MSKLLRPKGTLDPVTGLTDRTFIRTQGCWNCKHGSYELAKKWWLEQRDKDLQTALGIALSSPMGEEEPRVKNIRRMTALVDEGVGSSTLTKCMGGGVNADDNPVGDLVKANYLCRKWSGAQGASIARAGEAADPLPMELEDKTK